MYKSQLHSAVTETKTMWPEQGGFCFSHRVGSLGENAAGTESRLQAVRWRSLCFSFLLVSSLSRVTAPPPARCPCPRQRRNKEKDQGKQAS